jgi:glutamyl-tRNA reductase
LLSQKTSLNRFKIIAFTHKTLGIDPIAKLHLPDAELPVRLTALKGVVGMEEVMCLSTCNRVEFLIAEDKVISEEYLSRFFTALYNSWSEEELTWAVSAAVVFEGEEAVKHLFSVASSIDSLVVGEREIITQVRNAYELCRAHALTGDLLRLVMAKTIENAKEVYTRTDIACKPVSVVSLAYRRLRELKVKLDARFIIIGSGVTNTAMSRYLKKHGFTNFTVFNRTLSNAKQLSEELGAKAYELGELKDFEGGFDVILTCTGAKDPVITKEIYTGLLMNDKGKKIVIDLAVPNDVAPEVLNSYDINLIAVNNLQEIANENLKEREKELEACERIIGVNIEEFKRSLKERKVEIAMSDVPKKVREIRELAVNEIFAKDIEGLDPNSKEVLEKILSYMEKKYISVPMKMAKEILMEEASSK